MIKTTIAPARSAAASKRNGSVMARWMARTRSRAATASR